MMRAQQKTREYSVRDELETVTLVDAGDNAIGFCGKIAAHQAGQLHRAFSILITNPAGELLLQRRAACKYHFAGRWSNTCCGHPRPGEQTMAAARRRLWEEFGFSVRLEKIGKLQYRTVDPASGLIENEHLHVFQGHYANEPCPNPDEVGEYRWMLPSTVLRSLARYPDTFTPWFALLAASFNSNDGIGPGLQERLMSQG